MAANFRIRKTRRTNRLDVTLSGHFDGSSAAHLANVLARNHHRYGIIHIDTDALVAVSGFARQVLRARLMGHAWAGHRCRFSGRWAQTLQEQLPTARSAA